MRLLLSALALALSSACAQAESPPVRPLPPPPGPAEIVAAAPAEEWAAIAASDLLVMELAADAKARERRVTIQLMPPPFSQGWIGNVRKLAAAHWWDGTSINRVQDNYVVQWGDAEAEDKAKAKALPQGLEQISQTDYGVKLSGFANNVPHLIAQMAAAVLAKDLESDDNFEDVFRGTHPDPYAEFSDFWSGWQLAANESGAWPVHCYAAVGVARNLPPDTGTGAELYAVIGHAPRHLDRNIAVVGRVIEGIEHLSALPRGTGGLGFYETAEERVTIRSVRLGSEIEADHLPRYEYLSTESASFARYAEARANRRDAFFLRPAGGADVCNIPVPVRRVKR